MGRPFCFRMTGFCCRVAKALQKRKKANPKVRPFGLNIKPLFGSGGRDRTYDQLINSQLLYR